MVRARCTAAGPEGGVTDRTVNVVLDATSEARTQDRRDLTDAEWGRLEPSLRTACGRSEQARAACGGSVRPAVASGTPLGAVADRGSQIWRRSRVSA